MSGIITGPYFRSYFQDPSALEVGTMVAVLEIGAFSTSLLPFLSSNLHVLIDRMQSPHLLPDGLAISLEERERC